MAGHILANIDSYDAMICPNNSSMLALPSSVNCSGVTTCEKQELNINMYVPMAMMLSGIIGNLAALLVLFTLSKEVRKTVYYPLLAGLAWTDLIGQVVTSPIPLLSYSKKVELTGTLCMFHGFMMVFFGLITPLLICVLSIERLLSLKFTYFYHRSVTARKAKLTILMCWLVVMIFCSFPLMGFGRYSLQFPCTWCFLKFHRKPDTSISVYTVVFGFINLILIAIMVVCNALVAWTLLRMRRHRKINSSPSSSIKKMGPSTPPPPLTPKLKIEMEIKMVWFLSCITIVFIVCWVPFNVNILQSQLSGHIKQGRDLITVRLASINQIIDPWLYILLRGNLVRKLFNYIKSCFPYKGKRMREMQTKGIKINFPKQNADLTKRLNNAKDESHYNMAMEKLQAEEIGPCSMQDAVADACHMTGDTGNAPVTTNHNNNNNDNEKQPMTKAAAADSCHQSDFDEVKWDFCSPSGGKLSLPGRQSIVQNGLNVMKPCLTFPSLTGVEQDIFESQIKPIYDDDSSV